MTSKNNSGGPPNFKRLKLPNRENYEMFGKVSELMGVNNVKVICEDGETRICRIPGKLFKHIWIKPNDVVIVQKWDFQPSKGDVTWRFLGFQVTQLEKRNLLDKLYSVLSEQ